MRWRTPRYGTGTQAETERATVAVGKRNLFAVCNGAPDDLIFESCERARERVPVDKAGSHRLRGVDRKRLPFAQRQQTKDMVEVPVRQHHGGDRGMPFCAGMQGRCRFNGRSDLRARVEQDPTLAICAEGRAFLRPRLGAESAAANPLAKPAGAVPLRKATPDRRAENSDLHVDVVGAGDRPRPVAGAGSDFFLGEFVAVGADLRIHADFLEGRRFPGFGHGARIDAHRPAGA